MKWKRKRDRDIFEVVIEREKKEIEVSDKNEKERKKEMHWYIKRKGETDMQGRYRDRLRCTDEEIQKME